MQIKRIYVNLPVKDLDKTRAFWTELGFKFNEQFSNDTAIALILNDGNIYAMLLKEDYFKTFTNRNIADGTTTQVLNAIEVDKRELVEQIVEKAVELGGEKYSEPQDHGWMYQHGFADIDGHQWEVLFVDEFKIPENIN